MKINPLHILIFILNSIFIKITESVFLRIPFVQKQKRDFLFYTSAVNIEKQVFSIHNFN